MTRIRRLTEDDLDGCLELAVQRGWPPERHKWRYLLEFSAGFGAFDTDDELVGTTLVTLYGNGIATISMVLVAQRCERMGIGGQLMKHAMDVAGEDTMLLYATQMGRPLYERLGFRAAGAVTIYNGHFTASPPAPAIRRAVPADLGAIIELDTEATGFHRGPLLRRLGELAELVVAPAAGTPTGYGAAWCTVDKCTLGPVIAPDRATARRLITALAHGRDRPVRLDLNEQEHELRAWVRSCGLVEGSNSTLMIHSGRPLPGNREHLFSPFMQALG